MGDQTTAPDPRSSGTTAAGGQDLAAAFGGHGGTVTDFDDHAGAGSITDQEGRRWSFHCTAIADGSRTIAPGTTVGFSVVPGPNGLEAAAVTPR